MNNDEMLEELVEDFCRRAQLYGCDAVQVLLSLHNDKDGTRVLKNGRGNWYSRQGMAKEFIDEGFARTENSIRVTEFDEPEDGD